MNWLGYQSKQIPLDDDLTCHYIVEELPYETIYKSE